MSRERKPRAMGQLTADRPETEIRPTIVGGQPPMRRKVSVNVPVGVERLLYLAGTDAAFRQRLRTDRQAALADPRVRLRESERMLLRQLPESQLEAAIDNLDLSPKNVGRRRFLQTVAATAVAATVAGGCGDDTVATDGIMSYEMQAGMPDWGPFDTKPPDDAQVDVPIAYPDAGVPPDVAVDVPIAYPDAGVTDTAPVDVPYAVVDAGILPKDSSPDKP